MRHYSRFKFIIIFSCITSTAIFSAEATNKKALIYHSVSNKEALDNVKKHGLYSALGFFTSPKMLLDYKKKENLSYSEMFTMPFLMLFNHWYRNFKKLGFEDQLNVIYFKPEEPGAKEIANFALPVDPNTTYVHNLNYRTGVCEFNDECQNEDRLYRQSRVLLSDYLKYLKEAEQMIKSRPDLEVQLDPQTAHPFYLTKDSTEKKVYSGEVIIPRWHIPASELIPVQDTIGRWEDINPVRNKNK